MGKSALLNALIGRRSLARTSRTPGKTRAINVYNLADRLYLVDLPGYGWARLPRAERRALGRLLRAYFVERPPAGAVWLLDLRRDPSPEDDDMGELLMERAIPAVIALTKADTVRRRLRQARVQRIRATLPVDVPEGRCVLTSTRTGEGVPALRDAIDRLVGRKDVEA